jgi:hypothetical protein
MHGGRSPAGIGHPRFKGGKYSKYLPKGIRSSYERAIGDPTLLSLHDDLALLEVRQVELMKRLSQAPPPWGEALELYNRAAGAGSDQQQTALLEQLGALLLEGAKAASAQEQAWAELRELVQEKARTAAAEVRQLVELGQTLTTEQALMLVKQLSQAVRENVKDPQVLRAIQRSLDALVLEDETGCRRRQRAEDGE